MIRKSFSKFGVQYPKLDTLSSLADSGMLSWETQVEAAVEDQDDEFWEKVMCIQTVIIYIIYINTQ